jgi:purine-binding chemotaxis protein CheW
VKGPRYARPPMVAAEGPSGVSAPAQTGGSARAPGDKLVCFRVGGQEYGAAIADVKESLTLRPVTRVFLTPPWLAGIMNLRGDVVPVIDLGRFLGLAATTPSDDGRIVLVQRGAARAGLLVDSLAELRVVDADALGPPPSTLSPDIAPLFRGLARLEDGVLVRVLDLAALFEHDRLRTLDGLREA